MFFFAANADQVDKRFLRAGPHLRGKVETFCHGAAVLLWTEDVFTNFSKRGGRVHIEMRRPAIDREPICSLDWHFASGKAIVRRRWSGEFTVYLARQPAWAIASHLRLIALAFGGTPPRTERLKAGWRFSFNCQRPSGRPRWVREAQFRAPFRWSYMATVAIVKKLVTRSIAAHRGPVALLLSGGVDSSVIAAVAKTLDKRVHAFVFSLRRPLRPQEAWESDIVHARRVAAYLGIPSTEILLDPSTVVRNAPFAVWLGETARGTIVDPCAALVEVARRIHRAGFSRVWMGEAADDMFGGLDFALRYYRGRQLKRYFQRELTVGLPDEMAILQKVFEPWGVSLVDPFWKEDLMRLGYNLPLRYRVDPQRRMKRVLRDAFADILPPEIVNRPKGVTRDTTQVRNALERQFGRSRQRYRPIFKSFFGSRVRWPAKSFLQPQKS